MGFSFRKSFGKKNLRLNLSKSGVSISTGIKGLRAVKRLGSGRTTLYVQKSIGGVQLKYIKSNTPKTNKQAKPKKIKYASNNITSCSNCHKQIESDSSFCQHCGVQLINTTIAVQSPKYCSCGMQEEIKESIELEGTITSANYCPACKKIGYTHTCTQTRPIGEEENTEEVLNRVEESIEHKEIMNYLTNKWNNYEE